MTRVHLALPVNLHTYKPYKDNLSHEPFVFIHCYDTTFYQCKIITKPYAIDQQQVSIACSVVTSRNNII